MAVQDAVIWLSPAEIIQIGFTRSRVVMMNEAHNRMDRCIRTRIIGKQVFPYANSSGVRHLAMEALTPRYADLANQSRVLPDQLDEASFGYLSQPDMRNLIQEAIDLGWTLIPYEANLHQNPWKPLSVRGINWREEEQARNLTKALEKIHEDSKLLVWCGGSHHSKQPAKIRLLRKFIPMGYHFMQYSGINPFCIDQNVTVEFPFQKASSKRLLAKYGSKLHEMANTAGFLREEGPLSFRDRGGVDAFILSTDNELVG